MKSLMLFLEAVLNDLSTWCDTSTHLDLKKIKERVEHEGLSFLTITLATFGKDFERSLDQGYVGHDQFLSFSSSGGLPRLFSGFLVQVFDRSTGRLLDEPSVVAIWALRQITLMWAKMLLPCTEEREIAAIDKFIDCESDVEEADRRVLSDPFRMVEYSKMSTLLWADVFSKVDEDVYYDRVVPTHGPGATAEKLVGNNKWLQAEWTERLEEVFPSWIHLSSNFLLSLERLDHVDVREPGRERPVRVVLVPKTLKTPRVIAIEPTCMQYVQQGILRSYTEALERDDILTALISSESQEPNQLLAQRGSLYGDLASLDLSEASDRVSDLHVRLLLHHHPHLRDGVDACRSRTADVPGHGVIPLAKFASMGSALTFPMESLVFCTVIFLGIQRALGRQLTRKDVRSFVGSVRVYGDDLIVPVEMVSHVVEELEFFGFRVNSHKSFWTGKFRESCGKDYYAGHDVSIVKLRRMFPAQRERVQEVVSSVSTRNQLYRAGMWKSARFIDDLLEGINFPLPVVEDTSPVFGRVSFLGYETQKLHVTLHSPLVKGYVESSKSPASQLDDYGALLKTLSHPDNPDEEHLSRAGRPQSTNMKLRWAQPF